MAIGVQPGRTRRKPVSLVAHSQAQLEPADLRLDGTFDRGTYFININGYQIRLQV